MFIGRALDVVGALKEVKTVHETLKDKRQMVDDFHSQAFKEAAAIGETVGIVPSIPRLCSRQTRRNNTPADTPEDYYKRVITIPFLDHLLQEFLQRFTPLQQRAATAFLLLPPVDITLNDESLDFFREDLPSDDTLQAKIECWRNKWDGVSPLNLPTTIGDLIKECDPKMYPNVHISGDKLRVRKKHFNSWPREV